MNYEIHAAAELFPLVQGADFEALVEDIRANGQMEPIVLDTAGKLIDGRNRARACERLKITPTTKVYEGNDVWQFVISHNLHRRHMTDAQKAIVAARMAERAHGQRGPEKDSPDGESLPPTNNEAAQLLGISKTSIGRAKELMQAASSALLQLASDGQVELNTALRVATELDTDEQEDFVAQVRAGANPRRIAPPAPTQKRNSNSARPPAPPRYGGARRKHLQQIDALITAVTGLVMALEGVEQLDASVTAEEATRLASDLSRQIRGLTRINNLIKERTP